MFVINIILSKGLQERTMLIYFQMAGQFIKMSVYNVIAD